MSINQYLIEEIKAKYKITDYLASKGIHPVNQRERYVSYLCPLHTDKHPSFMIYKDENGYENYHCFGCGINGIIISIYAALEHVTWQKAIEYLGNGIVISEDHKLNVTIDELKKEISDSSLKNANNIFGEISLQIACMGLVHMRKTNMDPKELSILENLYKKVDECVNGCDIESLSDIYSFISGENNVLGKNVFEYRMSLYIDRQNKIMQDKLIVEELNGSKPDNM